jgi:hypothetical protein
VKHRIHVPDVGVTHCPHSAASNIGLRHTDSDRDHGRTRYEPTPVLGLSCEVLIKVNRVLIHTQQAQQGVVEFVNRPAGPMRELITLSQLVEPAAVAHDGATSQIPCRSSSSISASV